MSMSMDMHGGDRGGEGGAECIGGGGGDLGGGPGGEGGGRVMILAA
jgi:hypothetical protein